MVCNRSPGRACYIGRRADRRSVKVPHVIKPVGSGTFPPSIVVGFIRGPTRLDEATVDGIAPISRF